MRRAILLIIIAGLGAGAAAAVRAAPAAAAESPADAAAEEARKACFDGRWFLVQNRLDEAIAKLEVAVSLLPNYAEAKELLAQAQGRRAETDKRCDQAVALAKQGKWDDAIQEVQWGLMFYPGSAKAKGLLQDVQRQAAEAAAKSGSALAAGGNLAAAESVLRQSLEIAPDQAPAREVLARLDIQRGRAAMEQGRPGAAYLWFSEAAEFAPQNAEYQTQKAAARATIVERLRFAVARDPPAAVLATGQFSDAAWNRVAETKPDFLAIVPAQNAAGAALAVSIDAMPVEIRTFEPKRKARIFSYKTTVQETNPNFEALIDRLAAARQDLSEAQVADQQYWSDMQDEAPDLVYAISMAKYNIINIQNAIARTNPRIMVPITVDWPYSVETTEKTGTLEATIRVTHAATGQPVAAEAVRADRKFEGMTVRNAKPEIGLRDIRHPPPSDAEVRRAVLAAGVDEAAAKVLASVLEPRAAGLQALSQKFLAEGKVVPAVEMGADASVIQESLSKAEASRLQAALRDRLRTAEKAAGPASVPPPPK